MTQFHFSAARVGSDGEKAIYKEAEEDLQSKNHQHRLP